MKILCRTGVIACLLVLILMNWSCKSRDESTRDTIKRHIISHIDNGFSVGTVVVFLSEGNEEYFTYGFSDTTRTKPITKQSMFEIGSISKTFTALMLADLVVQGKVKLDDPVEKYLPDSVKVPAFNGAKMTLEQLTTHTSGLPRMPDNFNPKDSSNPYADYGPENLYAFLNNYKLTRAAGKYEYSNLGVGLLGHILTRIYDKTYEDLLQEKICKPFGMTETSTLNTNPLLTTAHVGSIPVSHWDLNVFDGAGGIRSSGEDMLKYVKNQMGLTPSPLLPAMRLTQRPRHDAEQKMKIGLGWHMAFVNGDTIITHSGGTGGYRTFAGFSVKSKKAIIILNNSTKGDGGLGMYFFNQTTYVAPVKKPVAIAIEHLKDKVGVYKVTTKNDIIKPGSDIEIKLEGDHLAGRTVTTPWVKIFPQSEIRFFTQQEHDIIFVKNPQGKIQTIKIRYPGGFELSADRSK